MGDPVIKVRHVATLIVAAGCLSIGCTRRNEQTAAEVPPLNVTNAVTSWTEKTELFMEHPPLVAGQTVRFAVHLTRLGDFSALNAGRPNIQMTPEAGGSPVVLAGSDPLRPGAFRVEGKLPPAGRYRWALDVEAPGLTDRHDLGLVTVFTDEAGAVADAEKRPLDDASGISYLKEQQWTNEFATTTVGEADVRTAMRIPATIEPVTGGEAFVGAPAAGRYMATALPSVGDRIGAGRALGRIEPRLSENGADRATLEAGVAEARSAVEAARADLARAERLLAERALPARRVEEARRAVGVTESKFKAAQARLAQRDEVLGSGGGAASGNSFVLRAPIAGRVVEVFAVLGASYQEGAPLFRIVRTDRVELQAQLPASDAPLSHAITGLSLEMPGRADPIPLDPDHVHDAGVIDPRTRALLIQVEVANPNGMLLIGQTGTAVIYTGNTQRLPVVPKAAVLTEAGRPYVFVQTGGESFARRFVDVAVRDGNMIGVRAGVKAGERVVTRGAYEVQLASATSGLPAEGHVH